LWKYSQQLSIQRAAVGVWNPTVAAVAKRDKWLYFLGVAKPSFSQCKLSREREKSMQARYSDAYSKLYVL